MISLTFKSYLGEDAVNNFINSMIKYKYCSDMMKKHFNKKLVMTKKMIKILRINAGFFDNDYVDGDVKVKKDHCHVTRKYRDSVHKDCNVKVELNHKTPIIFN